MFERLVKIFLIIILGCIALAFLFPFIILLLNLFLS